MSGRLLQLAKRDARRIITQGGFEENIELVNPNECLTISLTGFATKHWITFDTDGSPINSSNIHVSISEQDLKDLNYPYRDNNGKVRLLNHKVNFKDSSGNIRTYIISENFPDETLGIIVLILRFSK